MKKILLVIFAAYFASAGITVAVAQVSFTKQQICRAAIGAVFGQNPKIIKTDRESQGVIYLHYNRPSDGKYWDYRCKLEGSRVIWASVDGRWRNHQLDEKLEFSEHGGKLTINELYADGSKTTNVYTGKQLAN